MDELLHRYVFERRNCGHSTSKAARFLEAELLKEVYFLRREERDTCARTSVLFEGDALVARARAWIDARLFEPFRHDALVVHCRASESTVLRAFRRELGVTPLEYVRRRRLEAGLRLLESGRYGVSEVALRVGYGNVSAFSTAFRAHFGEPPSRARASRAAAGGPSVGTPGRSRRSGREG